MRVIGVSKEVVADGRKKNGSGWQWQMVENGNETLGIQKHLGRRVQQWWQCRNRSTREREIETNEVSVYYFDKQRMTALVVAGFSGLTDLRSTTTTTLFKRTNDGHIWHNSVAGEGGSTWWCCWFQWTQETLSLFLSRHLMTVTDLTANSSSRSEAAATTLRLVLLEALVTRPWMVVIP